MPVPKRKRPDDYEEETPRRRPSRASRDDDEDEEETPRRRRPSRDDEEDAPPRRRRSEPDDDEEEEQPRSRRGSRRGSDDDDDDDDREPRRRRKSSRSDDDEDEEESSTGLGWDKVTKRKVYEDTHGSFDDKKKPVYMRMANSFFLKTDEEAVIQFLTGMPMCADGYLLRRPDSEMRDFYVSQKPAKKYCMFADAGYKPTWRACFKVLDFRKYNKDKKRNVESNEPTEKYWLVAYALAEQIQAFANKKGRDLTEMTIRVSKTGTGQKTRYNFEMALDDRDRPLKPIEWEEELPTIKEAMRAPSEEEIERLIHAERNADRDSEKRSRNKNRGRSRSSADDDEDDDTADEAPF